MEYLIRFSQSHETFRLAEIQALATLASVALEIVSYDPESPFCVVRLADDQAAAALVRRSLLVQSIHELWGRGDTLPALHDDVRRRAPAVAPPFATASFKMDVDSFQAHRSGRARLALIDTFAQSLPLQGDIDLTAPDCIFTVFEHWAWDAMPRALPDPERYFLGRYVAGSARDIIRTFDLKKRRYIATTSMDAELSLLTANLALAAPGKLFYDPFVGTGSFPLAAAHWGALAWGSDIDGQAVRGSAAGAGGSGGSGGTRAGRCDVRGNFEQYGLLAGFGDVLTADLTHMPLRRAGSGAGGHAGRWIDGIVCDPPYGVREGPRVLGVRNPAKTPWLVETGRRKYKDPAFVPPKQPYSFTALLDDLLCFAADTLVDDGRLSFWMPTANDAAQALPVPTHPCLAIVSVCVQVFNTWSRRLITYRRLPDAQVDQAALAAAAAAAADAAAADPQLKTGRTANELNPFRRGYFRKFEPAEPAESAEPAEAKKEGVASSSADANPESESKPSLAADKPG